MTPNANEPISPLGIRMCAGLLAPFMSDTGKAEIETVYGVTADRLYDMSVDNAWALDDIETAAGALGVFFRNRQVASDVAGTLGSFAQTLPSDVSDAQAQLDRWTAMNTLGLISTAPVNVNAETEVVAASAVAVDAPWLYRAVRFADSFLLSVPNGPGYVTADDRAFLAVGFLKGGLEARFAMSEDGDDAAIAMLSENVDGLHPADVTSQWVTSETAPADPGNEVPVARLPRFAQTASHNLLDDAERYGLGSVKSEGVPGLDAVLDQVAQNVMVEITETGVKAAAVTMASMTRGMTFGTVDYLSADFTQGRIAYGVYAHGVDTPIVAGIYAP